MVTYKNISFSAKTFYGVKFEPGEIKSVPGYINNPSMIRVFGVKPTVSNDTAEKDTEEPTGAEIFDATAPVSTRGRKKKSSEPENGLFAETQEIK